MSGASVSSFGSANGSGMEGLRPNAGEEDHILDEPHTIQLGIFGVLYTVSKEKELTSVKFAFFRLFLDFLQLWLLVVNPSYGWAINAKNRAWEVVSFIQLNAFLSDRGYSFFLALFYVFVGLLGVNLALSVWVAYSFSNNRFEYVWPIRFLRWFGLIFYQVLDIATLTLLLVALDCNYLGVPDAVRFHNQEFPDVMCWSMPHIIHVAVSGSSIVLFVIMATCMVLSEMELNPLTRNYMAMAHTRDEGLGFIIKTILTVASVMLSGSLKALSLVYLFLFATLFYTCVKWVPFIYGTLNYVRCATNGMVMYSSVLFVVLAFGPSAPVPETTRFRERLTLALWVGMGPAALAGAAMCHLRLRHISYWVVDAFREAEPGTNSKSIYRFTDAREVEIAARCCRRWIDEDTLEPEAVALSEQIIKAGMIQLPQDPQMIILYSSFLIDVQGSYQSGYTQLQTAKKQSLALLERFAIFSREQEHTQKASGASSGDAAVDLVSYVEFQRNHRLVVRAHKEALMAIRAFWGLLLRSTIDFNNLSKALNRIEVTVKAAERAYRGVLIRHSGSARIVRLYGKFLESVKFDPWAASKWYTEADKLEEEAEHSKEAMQLGGIENLLPQGIAGSGGDKGGLSAIEGLALFCINAQGQIQVASPEAHALLGYGKNELKGRDLGIIMPHPFSERHTAYVRQYIHTGVSTMLGKHLEVMVITKTRQVLAVRMHVTKISGLNEDSVFLGMIEPLPPSPDDARLWILGTGMVVAADSDLCDWLGYDATDLAGKPLVDLLVEKEAVHEAIKSWNRSATGASSARQPAGHPHRQRRHSSNVGEGLLGAVMNMPSPLPGAAGGLCGEPSIAGVAAARDAAAAAAAATAAGSKPETSRGMAWLRRASFVEPALLFMSSVGPHGPTHVGGEVSSTNALPPMVLPRAAWRHKYLDPLEFDTYIQPGAVGSVRVHSVIVRRAAVRRAHGPFHARLPDPYYHDMLLVADHQGRVLHATEALAAALGRTVEAIRAGGMTMLVPEPTSVMHGPWLQELSNPQSYGPLSNPQYKTPPYSCRSGLSVSLSSYSEAQGPGVKQFQVSVTQRLADGGGSKIHVASLMPRTLDEALSERRLHLTLDLKGNIIDADSATPAELFGASPRAFVGSCISQLVDLFEQDELYDEAFGPLEPSSYLSQQVEAVAAGCSGGAGAGTSPSPANVAAAAPPRGCSSWAARGAGGAGSGIGGFATGGACGVQQHTGVEGEDTVEMAAGVFQAAFARHLSRALLQLAKRSADSPDCSWRVGVNLPPDEAALAELQQLAAAGALGSDELVMAAQLMGARTVPAVMKLRLVRRQPQQHLQRHRYSDEQQGRHLKHQHSRLQGDLDAAGRGGGGSYGADVGSTYVSCGGSHVHRFSNTDSMNGVTGGTYSPGVPPVRQLLHNGDSLLPSRGVWQRAAGGGGGGGGYGGGGDGPSLNNFSNGFSSSVGAVPQSLMRAAGGNDGVRLVLPVPGESQNGFGAVNGSVGFQLPPMVTSMRSPVRLDALGGASAGLAAGGSGSFGGSGGGDVNRCMYQEMPVQSSPAVQGVWAPVMRAQVGSPAVAAAAAEAAEAERAWVVCSGAVGGSAEISGGGRWQRAPSGVGPVAEAMEQPGGAAGDAAAVTTLSEEDEAVLEQLASTVDESTLPSARTASSRTFAMATAAPPTAGAPAGVSARSTPPPLSPTGSSGESTLAAAVAAAVERTNSSQKVGSGTPGSRSVNPTPLPSFASTNVAAPLGPQPGANPMQATPVFPLSAQQLKQQARAEVPAVQEAPQPVTTAAVVVPAVPAPRELPSPAPSQSTLVGPSQLPRPPSPVLQHQPQHQHPQQQQEQELWGPGRPSPARQGCGGITASKLSSMRILHHNSSAAGALLEGDPLGPAVAPAEAAVPSRLLVFEVELWRSDLLSGVLEVDDKGKVLRADAVCPLGQAGLVLGSPQMTIVGAQVQELIQLPGGNNGVVTLLDASSSGAPAVVDNVVRGALKKRVTRAARLGGTTVVTVRHQSDGCPLNLQVTAVRRPGPPGSAYLVLRPSMPTGVQPGFLRWLYDNDVTGLMSATRRGTVQSTLAGAAGGSGGASGINGTKAQATSPVASLECMAAAAVPAGFSSPPLGTSVSGLAAMVLADRVAASGMAGAPDSALLLQSEMPSASVPRNKGTSLAMSTVLPQPPAVQPIETLPVSGSLRVAAMRSSLVGINGAMPSRLSIISVAGQSAGAAFTAPVAIEDSAEMPAVARGHGALLPPASAQFIGAATADYPEVLVSNVSLDTAFERGTRTMETSIENLRTMSLPPASTGMESMTRMPASQPHQTTPRQSASLLAVTEQQVGESMMRNTSRKGKMPDAKHSMVQTWVLSDGREHTPDVAPAIMSKADSLMSPALPAVMSGAKGLTQAALPSTPAHYRPDGGSDAGGGDDDRMSEIADGDGPSSEEPAGSAGGSGGGRMGSTAGGGRARGGGAAGDDSARDGEREEMESEAGAMVANYSVGKRFKKLCKILMSPLAMQPARRLRWRTLAAVLLILSAHTVTFTLILVQLLQQQSAVQDLHSVANAARNVHEIAIGGRVLESLYTGHSNVPGLLTFGDPPPKALDATYGNLLEATKSLKKLHHGVYLGFRSMRRIPAQYGLRDIWDKPNLNMSLYYGVDSPASPGAAANNSSANVTGWLSSAVLPVGLWDAGNFYLSAAFDLISLGPNVTAQGANFANWSTWKVIHDNGVSVIFPAYLATLDALVGLTVDASRSIYLLQLIVLCLEGGMLCILVCAYMWIVAHQYSHKRHDLYEVFLQIPIGVTRGLANMSLNLEAANEEEDSDGDLPQDAAEGGGGNAASGYTADGEGLLTDGAVKAAAAGDNRRSVAGGTASQAQRRRASFTFGMKGMSSGNGDDFGDGPSAHDGSVRVGGAATMAMGYVGAISTRLRAAPSVLLSFAVWRRRARVAPHSGGTGPPSALGGRSRRRLLESHKLAYSLVAPFILWGAAIIAVNLVGYFNLKALTAPIATLNIVNVVMIRFYRVEFFVLEVAAALTAALCNLMKPSLAAELTAWRLEYRAMLYGNEVTSNRDDAHFRLATTGVLFGGYDTPAKLLYHTGSCLALDPQDCQPPESPFYQATHNGLDVLLKTYFTQVDSLVQQPFERSGLNSSEFNFVWKTGKTDAAGGLMQMADVFLGAVHNSYGEVIVQQIIMFVVAWVFAIFYLLVQLRPLVRRAENEMRRVAELLSQLPPEVDCETMVTAVVLGEPLHPPGQQGGKGKGGGAGGGGAGAALVATGSGGAGGGGASGAVSNVKQGHVTEMSATALNIVRRRSSMGGTARGDMAGAD